MDCCVVAGEGPQEPIVFWDDVLTRCDKFEHLHRITNHPPYTDAFKVVIDGVEAIWHVELPTW